MEKVERFLAKYPLLIIVLLSIPAIAALAVPGFYGASDDLHIAWLQQMDKVIREGQIPPRFVPDLSYGFGYPLFNFVFPLPFYIAEIFHLVGFSLVDSIKLLFALTIPLSGYFMYKLLKEFAKSMLALVGAVVYMYTPYRSTDIYVRGAIGEITAFVFLPLIVLSVVRLCEKEGMGKRWIGILALSTAALVLSHNIMAYMFTPFVSLFILFRLFYNNSPRLSVLLKIASGLVLGLLISIFFWFPALVESELLKYDTVFNFKDHFPTIKQLITPYFGWGASVPGPYDGMAFFIGLPNLVLAGFGILGILVWRKKLSKSQKTLLLWGLFVLMISIFMMNFRSSFVWELVPFIGHFQFPWRFLSMTTFVTPFFVIALQNLKLSRLLGLAIIFITIITSYNYFRPHDFLARKDNYYINRYIPTPIASEEYKKTSEEYLRLPKATELKPKSNLPRVVVSDGEITKLSVVNSLIAIFEISSDKTARVNYNKYFFPGWAAKVDGGEVDLQAGFPYGQIILDLPPGTHNVEVYFKETPFRQILNAVSLLSFIASVTIVIGVKLNVKKN